MDLKIFLDPVSERCLNNDLPGTSFQKSIFVNNEVLYDLDGIDVVLLGITEHRGLTSDESEYSFAPDEIRKKLYSLSKVSGKNRILDLGNLRNGPNNGETALRLQEVCSFLLQKEILPVIIGGTHDMDLGQFRAYEPLSKLITCLNVDAKMDLHDSQIPAHSHISKILKHDPNFLFNYVHLAYQTYLVDPAHLGVMEKLYFEAIRLGEFRENIQEIEPVIRDADMVTFDLSAINSQFMPAVESSNVFGLTGEEACQLCWYSGLNDKLSSIGIYGYDPARDDDNKQSASVIATMIWYFLDGFYHRKGDKNFMSNDYLVYEVQMGGSPETIRFYKSKLSEKWWMEIPDENSDSVFLRNKMIPCSYSDYKLAADGKIPDRWISATSK